jgi:hypothetical protein
MMDLPELNLNLLYKTNNDEFNFTDFHNECDKKGPTICVVKSELGRTFGGFTNLIWDSSMNLGFIEGEGKSFIFQLDFNLKLNCIRREAEIANNEYAIYFGSDIGIQFCNSEYENKGGSYFGMCYEI